MTDFLDEKRSEIDARLKELKPLVAEYDRLEKAAAALSGVNEPSSSGRSSRSRGSSRRRSSGSSGSGRRGRPRGTGKRALQAEELVKAQPGITIAELAESMDIAPNYLYRVMPTLQGEGKVKKQGSGWHPA